jgi:hypothetical protein
VPCRRADSWLRRYACQSAGAGTITVFVATETGDTRVVDYYAWCILF